MNISTFSNILKYVLPTNSFVNRVKTLAVSAAFLAAMATPFGLLVSNNASAANIDNDPDCDNYAVMWCGGFTMNQIENKYLNGDGHHTAANIKGIYKDLGISEAEVKANGFVNGVVYRNGNVEVKDKVVAKNAKTFIRTMGKVDASKMGSAQTAFVKLNNKGQFMYAIMKPCGNPVSATNTVPEPTPTPTPVPTPIPTPTPVVPTPTPTPVTPAATPTPTPVVPTPTPTPAPIQTLNCTALVKVYGANRQITTEIQATTTNGATITEYSTNFGDGTILKGKNATHTYNQDGTFKIVATVKGLANGKEVISTSDACATTVKFEKSVPVCPTNPSLPANDPKCNEVITPSTLPNTGAGEVMAIFAATSAVGMIGHRIWLFRKN